MNPFFIGFPALLACLLVGYLLRERSLRNLDTSQAGTLVLMLRPNRIRYVKIAAALVAVFLILRFSLPKFTKVFFLLFLALFTVAAVMAQWVAWRALRKESFPSGFIQLYGTSQVFDCLGYLSIFGAMAATQFVEFED